MISNREAFHQHHMNHQAKSLPIFTNPESLSKKFLRLSSPDFNLQTIATPANFASFIQ